MKPADFWAALDQELAAWPGVNKGAFLTSLQTRLAAASDQPLPEANRQTRSQRQWWPVVLDLTGQTVLVVGGGRVGYTKVKALNLLGLRPVVVSPEFDPRLAELECERHQRGFDAADLVGVRVVIACTNNSALNDDIARRAQALGLLVNHASRPEAGDFVAPACLKQGPWLVAVSSGGSGPKASVALREALRPVFEAWAAEHLPDSF